MQKLGAENPPTAFLRYSPRQYWVLHLVKIGWPGPSALSDHRRIPRRTCFPNPRAFRSPNSAFIMPSLRPTILSYLEDHVAKRLANHKTTSGDIPINRAINDILDRPENRECIKEHIEKLAERTLASRAAFEKISSLLRLFDSKKYRTKDGHDIPTLHPTWDELRMVS